MIASDEFERLSSAAAQIRASGGLGRSRMLHRLFDYLLDRTLHGETPKEVEVAADVFGKSEADLLVDASVRVYVHRLRKKLDDYYAASGLVEGERLTLPKGDYRFRLAAPEEIEPENDPALEVLARGWHAPYIPWLLLALGLIAGAVLALVAMHDWSDDGGLNDVRATALWSPIVSSARQLTIVTGDYYIMGERDAVDAEPARLVREYNVNSREDLDALLMNKPDLRDRLVDLNLYYLPVSTAYALRSIMPIVTPGLARRHGVPVVPSSKLTPTDFKSGDIVYVGLMSGLGILQQPVFANSRFDFGGSFDELIDSKTGKVYVADPPEDGQTARRNYAYVAMLPGPDGNRILIVAGTRDPALLQAADIVNNPDIIKSLERAGKDGYFEALFAVDGVGDENLRGTLIVAGPRSTDGMWDGVNGAPANSGAR